MDVFDLRARLVADYQSYTRSFIKIRDPRINEFVDDALANGAFWPEPLLQRNPTFLPGGTIERGLSFFIRSAGISHSALFEVDLVPSRADELALADHAQHQEVQPRN